MGRRYQFSKNIAENQAAEILREIRELPNIKQAQLNTAANYLDIETSNRDYVDVMSYAVNLFSKAAEGCTLSFSQFLY
ncbi:MAG: hypothetical protein LIP16_02410 [Clostridium sp.]|nr:hypothetical protein [Clostridium sp.]